MGMDIEMDIRNWNGYLKWTLTFGNEKHTQHTQHHRLTLCVTPGHQYLALKGEQTQRSDPWTSHCFLGELSSSRFQWSCPAMALGTSNSWSLKYLVSRAIYEQSGTGFPTDRRQLVDPLADPWSSPTFTFSVRKRRTSVARPCPAKS